MGNSNDDDDGDGKMKIIVLVLCTFLLVAMVVAVVTVGHSRSIEDKKEDAAPQNIKGNSKAVQAICATTDYKDACVNSLGSTNATDLKELVGIAFSAAKKSILEASKNSSVIKEAEKDPRTKDAISNCQDLAVTAADDLDRSYTQMSKMELVQVDDILDNLKTWLSAAMTYQETCLDGFENTTGDAGEKMQKILKLGMQLTNNGLAMVTEISKALSSAGMEGGSMSRRLLSSNEDDGEYPSWIEPQAKRLLLERRRPIKIDLVVAKDGSGKFTSINKALLSIPRNSEKVFVLYVKEGVYEEKVQVDRNLTRLMMLGDGPEKTRITGSLNFIDGVGTFHTATVAVLGDRFIGSGIGFENSAGAEKHQAVALRVGADLSIFYNCHMDGYQDTLYTHTYRQFYRNCQISGTIDFIFGDSSAVFQNCTMLVRKPMENQANIVTAQGRKIDRQPTGIVLQNCSIVADPALYPLRKTLKSYLARPWKEFSRTIIMESYIDDLIDPEGFLPWNGTFALDTLYYAEYNNNYGPGSSKANRLKWAGIKEINRTEVKQFTANKFLGGEIWVRPRRIPMYPGSNKTNYIPFDSWFTRAAPKDNETDSDDSSSPTSKSPSTASPSPKEKTSTPSPSSSPKEDNKQSPSSSPTSSSSSPSSSPTSSSSSSSSPTSTSSPSSSPTSSSSPSSSPEESNKKSSSPSPSSS